MIVSYERNPFSVVKVLTAGHELVRHVDKLKKSRGGKHKRCACNVIFWLKLDLRVNGAKWRENIPFHQEVNMLFIP